MTQIAPQSRLPLLDIMRGIALIAMAIYHFGWDLAFFGYVTPQSVNEGAWKFFARCIASSFLILVGISLVLAHKKAIKWAGFMKRWLMIAGAALIITIATYYFTPDAFIFFGILHQIAFASIAGLLFLRLPAGFVLALGLLVIAVGNTASFQVLDDMYLAWTGLQAQSVRSNDFVPVFPWIGAVLIGMGISNALIENNLFKRLNSAPIIITRVGKILQFLGRNSLAVYLIHQPILISLIYLFSLGLHATINEQSVRAEFMNSCIMSAEEFMEPDQSLAYCTCSADGIEKAELWPLLLSTAELSDENQTTLFAIYDQCQ